MPVYIIQTYTIKDVILIIVFQNHFRDLFINIAIEILDNMF